MKYVGEFRSVLNDNPYKIEIITRGSSSGPVDVSLGPEAFVTSMTADSNTIYTPVKYQSATIQIVAKNYYFDLYARTPKENTVTLRDVSTNTIVWSGYTSCNVYDANYDFETESWSVECVDKLSVLKNYNYTIKNGVTKDFISFTDIIRMCLSKAGFSSSNYWYISTNTHLPGSTELADALYISEANFFDEDEEPMKMSEVLEEICKFMGVTCVAEGDKVYFLDYDAIKSGDFNFDRYTVGGSSKSNVSLSSNDGITHTISKKSYSSTGARLSLDNVYSKVTVRDNLYAVKSIIPSLFEDEDLVNVHYDSSIDQKWNFEMGTSCYYQGKNSWLSSDEKNAEDDLYFQWKYRYYTNKNYKHYFYSNSGASAGTTEGDDPYNNPPIQSALSAEDYLGVIFAKYNVGSGKTLSAAYANLEYDSFDNYLMVPTNYSYTTGSTAGGLKLLEADDKFSKPFFMSGKTKIVVKGDLLLTDRGWFPNINNEDSHVGYWPHTGTFHSNFDGNWWSGNTLTMTQNTLALKMSISVGTTTKTVNVPFYPYGELGTKEIKEDKKHNEIFYCNHAIQDNINYADKVKEKGYCVYMGISQDVVIPAKPKVTLYGFENLRLLFAQYQWSPLACAFIKDFDVIAVDPFEGGDSEVNATDTEYTYTINDEYTQELGTIEFKVCTSDTKNLNYSAVAFNSGGTYHFVDTLTNDALASKLQADDEDTSKRSEELMCYKIVKQYAEPAKKLTINMFEKSKDTGKALVHPYSLVTEPAQSEFGNPLTGCTFIVNTLSHNYSYDTVTCELVEKK